MLRSGLFNKFFEQKTLSRILPVKFILDKRRTLGQHRWWKAHDTVLSATPRYGLRDEITLDIELNEVTGVNYRDELENTPMLDDLQKLTLDYFDSVSETGQILLLNGEVIRRFE